MEGSRERVLARQEIMEALFRYAEGGKVTREIADKDGIYLLELTTEGPQEGETTEFTYRRKGDYPNKIKSPETLIEAAHYQDGFPVSANTLATYDPKTKEWTHNPIEEINKVYKKVGEALGQGGLQALIVQGHEKVLEAYKSICEQEKREISK